MTRWTVDDGLPGNHVAAIAQDADGFLWLATMAGLVRFDGVEFLVFNNSQGELPTSRFTALDVGPSGRLWIGSDTGDVLMRDGGHFRTVSPPHFPGMPVLAIAEAGDGRLWFNQGKGPGREDGSVLWEWTGAATVQRDDLLVRLWPNGTGAASPAKGGSPPLWDVGFDFVTLVRDRTGVVWAQDWNGRSLRLSDEASDPYDVGTANVQVLGSARLTARADQRGVDLLQLEDGMVVAHLETALGRARAVWLQDRRGLIWVSTLDALEVYRPTGGAAVARWPFDAEVNAVFEDREGNIWVGTRTLGLLRIAPSPITQIGPAQGIPLAGPLQAETDGSALFWRQMAQPAATAKVPISVYRIRAVGGLPEPVSDYSELRDRHGTLWRFANVASGDPKSVRSDGRPVGLPRAVEHLYLDPTDPNVLWADGYGTLLHLRLFESEDPRIDGEWPIVVRSPPWFDDDGGVWFGSTTGLHRFQGDEHQSFGRADGLPVDEVRALYPDPQRQGLWIGTYGGGLSFFDGARFRTVDQRHGLQDNAVSSIVPDRFGALWMAGNRGIQRVLLRELHAVLDGEIELASSQLFGTTSGLDNPEAIGPYSGVAVGEYLYFAIFSGLARIDPAVVFEREQHVPQVHVMDRSRESALAADSRVRLDPDRRDLDLGFTALHLAAPETLRFRYRLEGHDSGWIESGPRREVSYADLAPGEYRFRLQARHSGGPWVDAGTAPVIEAPPLWWETRAAMVLAGLGVLFTLVAAWHLANRQMRRRAAALEALVGERTTSLQQERDQVARQATRLQELAEGRARFMSGISHELRTPLSLILAPLGDLGDGLHGSLPESAHTLVIGAQRNAQRLHRLVERLLEVARVESGVQSLHCVEIDLRAALAELVDQLQPLAQQRGSPLEVFLPDQEVMVWMDPLLMESVLLNLVVNGLRHTPPGSCVRVELDPPEPGATSGIRIRISDNGPGIPSAALPHLFERFFRVQGEHASGSDGFGLGLPLVREVVERHGGCVDVESSPAGTCFTVQLRGGRAHLAEQDVASALLPPRQRASMLSAVVREAGDTDPDAPIAADIDPASDAKQVLVVDDNPELRRLLRSYLQPEFRVRESDTGVSALASIAEVLPDLIVTDVMMPEMDGHALCHALRANPETDFIPILMLTAKAGLEHRIEALEGGADAYLAKPFDRREFIAIVDGLQANRQRLRLHYQQHPDAPSDRASNEPPPHEAGLVAATGLSAFGRKLSAVVEQHLADESFDVEAMATAVARDRTTLYRSVKAEFGMSPSDLLRDVRLLRARELLQRCEGNVSEVAYAAGFRNVAHFSTSYRRRFGETPSQTIAQTRMP